VHEWAEALSRWETLRKELKGILVVQDEAKKVEKVARRAEGVTVIADEGGERAKVLNAVFVPRAYGFADGKLVWLQKEPNGSVVTVLQQFLSAVKGEGRAKSVLDAWSAERGRKQGGRWRNLIKGGRRNERQNFCPLLFSPSFWVDLGRVAVGHRDYRGVGRDCLGCFGSSEGKGKTGSMHE